MNHRFVVSRPRSSALAGLVVVFFSLLLAGRAAAQDLQTAISAAQARDPWLQGSEWRQEALQARGLAASALPEPVLRMGAANLPTDTFAFNQEPMTQFQVGLSQALPRGATRELERERLFSLGQEEDERRDERRARVALTVAELWLDCYRASRTQALIEDDRDLFLQLREIVASRYRSAAGGARQQDLVRAELELTRLDDRLARLSEQEDVARARLEEWLGAIARDLNVTLPDQEVLQALPADGYEFETTRLASLLGMHPSVRSLDRRIEARGTGISLARERYKPGFTVNAGYGYRDDAENGDGRADFFSLGVAVDLPIFTDKRQDQQLRAAKADAESLRTERQLLLRELRAGLETARARLQRLDQRRDLYRSRLLRELGQQAAAAEAAYAADDGDFAEAIRARIDELNARIEALEIDTERQRIIARLNYFLVGTSGAQQ